MKKSSNLITKWFAAVAAVFGNLIFQPLDTFSQLSKRVMEELDHSIFAFTIGCPYLCFARHSQWFHVPILLGFYVFDNVKVQSIQASYA
jgi:hypothetical protein